MDVLTLCWSFDSRWVFNIQFKLYMLWIPVIIDLITLIAFAIQQDIPGCCPSSSTQAILGLMIIGHISLMSLSYFNTLKQRYTSHHSKQYHDSSNTKKVIWSPIGLFIATMSFILLLLESCEVIVKPCGTAFVILRAILDITCWIYLVGIVFAFILCKIFYLIWAWKFPQSYLRYRQVVI